MERRGKSSPARQATVCKCKPYPMQHLHAGTRSRKTASCRPGRTAEAAERRLATTVTDRWQPRSSLRTEPGLQTCRKIPHRVASRSDPRSAVRDFSLFRPCLFRRFPLTKREASIYNRNELRALTRGQRDERLRRVMSADARL